MAQLNSIEKLPFMGDMVKDITFHPGLSMATIYFFSGKNITVHINDDGSYSIKDYHNENQENIKKESRERKINTIIDE